MMIFTSGFIETFTSGFMPFNVTISTLAGNLPKRSISPSAFAFSRAKAASVVIVIDDSVAGRILSGCDQVCPDLSARVAVFPIGSMVAIISKAGLVGSIFRVNGIEIEILKLPVEKAARSSCILTPFLSCAIHSGGRVTVAVILSPIEKASVA